MVTRKHWGGINIGLRTLIFMAVVCAVATASAPSAALAAGRPQMPPRAIPPYVYGAPYSIPGLPGLYVTVTIVGHTTGVPAPVDDSKVFVIPAPPYDPNWSEPWGSFQSYADWANLFRTQNRGQSPTMKDETDFWVSQAMGGALDYLQTAAAQAQSSPQQ